MTKTSEDIFEPAIPIVPPGWDVLPFEQAADVVSDKGKRIKQGSYLPAGAIPIIDQGQEPIGGYTNDQDLAYEGGLPVILFGDHTRSVKYVDRRFAVGAEGVKILRPNDAYVPKFFYYLLRSLQIPSRGYSRHFQFLRKLHFPLAPHNQQTAIVAEIEKQFSCLDEAVAALKRTKANLKRYKAAVLKAAVEGELTKNWRKAHPDVEPASKLLERVLNGRRQKWVGRGKYKEPVKPDTKTLWTLPSGWVWASPDQLSQADSNAICAGPFGTIFKAEDFRPVGVPIIFLRHVAPGKYLTHKPGFMDEQKWKAFFQPYSVYGGELLVTKLGEPPGACAIYPAGIGPAMVTPDVIKMSVNSAAILPKFLMHYLNSEIARRFATGVAFGTTRLRVTLPIFREMPVSLPPLVEQEEIVAEVERRLSVIEELEVTVEANLTRADRHRQSILKAAFAGRLFRQHERYSAATGADAILAES